MLRRLSFVALAGLAAFTWADKPITVTIIHSNDLHAHAEPVTIARKPYGGYARQATLIRRLRASDPNVLVLNAGDTFQGTLYFNVYEGLAEAAFMNAVGYQAATLGNHEFDRGPATLANFLKAVKFPVVSANVDVSQEPALRSLVKPSAVIEVGGEKFGIVGATTPTTSNISSPGPTVQFNDVVPTVQAAVDDLTKQGINKIIVLTHIGYQEDLAMVAKLHDVDLVVGGHSHSPLGVPALTGWPAPAGPYPTLVKDARGKDVNVVQAWEWGKVLGRLKIDFDAKGEVKKVYDAAPIVVDETIPEDPDVKALLLALEKPISNLKNSVVGSTSEGIARQSATPENLMANVVADAMLEATAKYKPVAAFVNSGGVRGDLAPGPITYGAALSVQPFNNSLVVLTLTGDELKRSLEIGAGGEGGPTGGFLNPSKGTSYSVDFTKPVGSRVSNVVVAGQPLVPTATYAVALLNFTANGGDAHEVFKNAKGARVDTGIVDLEALIEYLKAHRPTDPKPEQRIKATS